MYLKTIKDASYNAISKNVKATLADGDNYKIESIFLPPKKRKISQGSFSFQFS